MFLLETERLEEQVRDMEKKLAITRTELEEASRKYDDMKTEYESVEEQVDGIDASIEKAKGQLNETSMLKQQLENQIELLKEQINSMHMNDAHYDQRARTITSEIGVREDQLKELGSEEEAIQVQIDEQTKLEEKARAERSEEHTSELQSQR